MKVVLLAGGFGTRISEESLTKPKPMIEIGSQPILWHIMKSYSCYGFNEFIICAGYKQNIIKEYFCNYYLHRSNITFDFTNKNKIIIHNNKTEPWKVTVIDTGLNTMTGGRIKRVKDFIGNETFMMTYGDGLCDLNLGKLLEFHRSHGKLATLTAIQPRGRFGSLEIQPDQTISRFAEKRKEDGGWINGGFMVLEPQVIDYIDGDATTFEKQPLEQLSRESQLIAYYYDGFWQCMDTMRDKQLLEDLLAKGNAPWKVWED
ncbi:glucose-1-phosphate cytidylyltransferase [Flexilinea flocculi]|uniref:Glucose-1-phosphate cytidylyltransferase n=1 Tax=Flexilinea flocculi TaxID=1678840 RepID=A0A0K8P9Z3_9CHLR|nr:glucose-1-phosphate cytidylyltransferase [Flexilinea flocculi]GAP39477.1 glucose-1-phosphate cytidylyltransferase [Flexilinea flocculi]